MLLDECCSRLFSSFARCDAAAGKLQGGCPLPLSPSLVTDRSLVGWEGSSATSQLAHFLSELGSGVSPVGSVTFLGGKKNIYIDEPNIQFAANYLKTD